MRPEAELIVQCARRELDGAGATRLRMLASLSLDWPWLVQAADRHGVLPLLSRHLHTFPEVVPVVVMRALRERRLSDAARGLRLAAELVRLLDALAAAGLRAVTLKGPALGAALYGDLTLRTCRDLDLLVPEADLEPATLVIASSGYAAQPFESRPDTEPAHGGEWERVLVRGDDIVELHARLSPLDFAFRLDDEPLWQRLEPVRIAGRDVPTLGCEDLLLYLSAHGARHRWGRLQWIADIAELVHSRPRIDWGAIRTRARRLGGDRMLLLGLMLAADLLEAPVPDEVRARAGADRAVWRLVRQIRDRLFERVSIQPANGWEWLRWYTGVRERAGDKCRCVWRIVFEPGPGDWEWIRLPRSLSAIYFLTRPVRLAWKYLSPTQDTIEPRTATPQPQRDAAS